MNIEQTVKQSILFETLLEKYILYYIFSYIIEIKYVTTIKIYYLRPKNKSL